MNGYLTGGKYHEENGQHVYVYHPPFQRVIPQNSVKLHKEPIFPYN